MALRKLVFTGESAQRAERAGAHGCLEPDFWVSILAPLSNSLLTSLCLRLFIYKMGCSGLLRELKLIYATCEEQCLVYSEFHGSICCAAILIIRFFSFWVVGLSIRPAQPPLRGGTLGKEVHLRPTSWAWPEPCHPALLALGTGLALRALADTLESARSAEGGFLAWVPRGQWA